MALWRLLRQFLIKHRLTYSAAILMLVITNILNMILPWWIGHTVDALGAHQLSLQALTASILLMVGLGLAMYVTRYLWRRLLFGTAYQLGIEMRSRFYAKLLHLSPEFFHAHSSGDLLARATQDTDAVELAAGEGVLSSVDGSLTLLMVLTMMLWVVDIPLTLLAIIPFPILGFLFYRIAQKVQARFTVALDNFSRLSEYSQEALSGIRTLKTHALVDTEIEHFSRQARTTSTADYQVARMEARYDPAVFLTLGAAMLLTLAVGTLRFQSGAITLGNLTSFTLYLVELIWPMFAIGWCLNLLQRGEAGARRLFDVFDANEPIKDNGTLSHFQQATLDVKVPAFSYPNANRTVLQDIQFRLEKGKTLGIAGATGSGKSTILKLLMRQYEVTDGAICLDHAPISQYRLDTLHSAFAYVPQDAFLFAASLRDNLKLGKPDATDEELTLALERAAFSMDLGALPEGLDTLIGERGVTLSGGQRQRIALARALLSNAPVLLLDDTLSAVDYRTEQRLLKALDEEQHQRSMIVVSHRLSAIAGADEILVIENGVIVERGSHEALLLKQSHYAALWQHQSATPDSTAKGLS